MDAFSHKLTNHSHIDPGFSGCPDVCRHRDVECRVPGVRLSTKFVLTGEEDRKYARASREYKVRVVTYVYAKSKTSRCFLSPACGRADT